MRMTAAIGALSIVVRRVMEMNQYLMTQFYVFLNFLCIEILFAYLLAKPKRNSSTSALSSHDEKHKNMQHIHAHTCSHHVMSLY